MGMPVIIPGEGTLTQAVTDLIESIALQEAALAHIMNAEGEKMQTIIALPTITPEQLLTLNASVESLVNAITMLEMMLQSKLNMVTSSSAFTTSVSRS